MNREDVVKVNALKDELSSASRSFEQSMKTVFGELVYAVDGVVKQYNELAGRHQGLQVLHEELEGKHDKLATTVDR